MSGQIRCTNCGSYRAYTIRLDRRGRDFGAGFVWMGWIFILSGLIALVAGPAAMGSAAAGIVFAALAIPLGGLMVFLHFRLPLGYRCPNCGYAGPFRSSHLSNNGLFLTPHEETRVFLRLYRSSTLAHSGSGCASRAPDGADASTTSAAQPPVGTRCARPH